MNVTLLGLEFAIQNYGCQALAYSFAHELNKVAQIENVQMNYTAVVFAVSEHIYVPGTEQKIECMKIRYKSLSFWKDLRKLFKNSDLIVDFTGGDSFSDIYGTKRFYMSSLIKVLAIKSGITFILGPQTYGPYERKMVKRLASYIIRKSYSVYTRDEESRKYVAELSGRDILLTTDVAFSLPKEDTDIIEDPDCIKIGINPSGLLWNGGYEFAKIPLNMDYQRYCRKLLEYLTKEQKYKVYLIPHVGTKDDPEIENDYYTCKKLHEEFESTVFVEDLKSPMEAKGIISQMDVFCGARMHATIAAFSSGVATIPVSYSRKFEGLYGSLDYEYIIHACTESTEEALERTLKYIQEFKRLEKVVEDSLKKVFAHQESFREDLCKTVQKIHGGKN